MTDLLRRIKRASNTAVSKYEIITHCRKYTNKNKHWT